MKFFIQLLHLKRHEQVGPSDGFARQIRIEDANGRIARQVLQQGADLDSVNPRWPGPRGSKPPDAFLVGDFDLPRHAAAAVVHHAEKAKQQRVVERFQ